MKTLLMRLKAMRTRGAIGALLVLAATACGGAARQSAQADPQPGGGGLSAAEIEAIYRARLDSARMRFTDADVDFITGMVGHHAQALVMSGLAPANGANPSIQTLAARIINSQQDEIAIMQRWLRDRDQPVPEVEIEGTNLMVHGAEHAMHMPGMLTPEQMRELEQARGPAFDRLFLTYMIQHHRGAVTMVGELFSHNGAGQGDAVFKLASDINADQLTEIERMERMLAALPAQGDSR
ncbi:MAG: DUF305 domain-containing protein [Longimicrobiales bacterium]